MQNATSSGGKPHRISYFEAENEAFIRERNARAS